MQTVAAKPMKRPKLGFLTRTKAFFFPGRTSKGMLAKFYWMKDNALEKLGTSQILFPYAQPKELATLIKNKEAQEETGWTIAQAEMLTALSEFNRRCYGFLGRVANATGKRGNYIVLAVCSIALAVFVGKTMPDTNLGQKIDALWGKLAGTATVIWLSIISIWAMLIVVVGNLEVAHLKASNRLAEALRESGIGKLREANELASKSE